MSSEATTTLERSEAAPSRSDSGVKSILLHIQNDRSLDQRIETALSLARACGAHLECVHVTPIEAYVAFDNFGGVFVMNDVIKALDDEELRLRATIETKLRSEDATWDYYQVTGNVPSQIIRHAALADLIIVGREQHQSAFEGPDILLLGDLLHRSRTPLFIPPSGGSGAVDPAGTAVIAWDASPEAAHAVKAAVGLLRLSSDVRVVQVKEREKEDAFTAVRLMEYLSRHGIHADLQTVRPVGAEGGAIAGILVDHAEAVRAAYMVLGGYNHSRVGEYLFGGVTRALLADCPLPLLMAH